MNQIGPQTLSASLGLWAMLIVFSCASSGKSPSDQTTSPDTAADSGGAALDCAAYLTPDIAGCLQVDEYDENADTRWPDLTRRQYDDLSRLLSWDVRGGESPDTELVCGNRWTGDILVDEWCRGTSNYQYTNLYDTQGKPSGREYDAGADGTLDKVWTYTLDANDRIVEVTVDDDVDGTPDALQTFTWDESGHLVRETWDYTYNGVADYIRSLEWDGDNLLVEHFDTNGDGIDDRRTEWAYNENGQPVDSWEFEGDNTQASESTHWTYDGCALVEEVTASLAGSVTRTQWGQDERGRTTSRIEDWDEDGVADRIWVTTYQCPGG